MSCHNQIRSTFSAFLTQAEISILGGSRNWDPEGPKGDQDFKRVMRGP